ncbi:hypothetical protein,putative calcium-binding protein [Xenococcus sp. PCC 7305]|uniref:CRTAC homolog protein n=1 Tax=Xenococcus sp. PCC 7305 TaxID=102125 RepID=UPI0002ACEBCD|nr:CRTAC homolog protein [Xenococcus sp. PCC 7305]ELS05561.1 hypothetical protein,putative calcium-binding protein [Xenococcus sp. PCC 7305]
MTLNFNSFQDITGSAGIVWSRHRGDEAMSVAWLDYNQDGLSDLWVSGHGYNGESPNSLFPDAKYPFLYINNGDGTFTNLFTEDWRQGSGGDTHGTNWIDFDNDGDRDVFVNSGGQLGGANATGQPNHFFVTHNSDLGLLSNESTAKGVVYQIARSRSSIWFDGNNDGRLDFINLVAQRPDGQGSNAYFEQQIDGTFIDQSNAVGLDIDGSSRYGQLADLTGDGILELVIQGTYEFPLEVYDISNGFVNITNNFNFPLTSDLPVDPTEDFEDHASARDSVIADFNGDGYNDIFLVRSSIATVYPSVAQNNDRIIGGELIIRNIGEEIGYSFQTSGTVAIDFFSLNGIQADLDPSEIFLGTSGRNPTAAELEAFVNISSATTSPATANDNPLTSEIDRVAALALNPTSPNITGLQSDRSARGVYIGYDANSQTWEIRLNSDNFESIRSAVESTADITNLQTIGFTNVDPDINALSDQLWVFDPNTNQFIDNSGPAGLTSPTLAQSVISGDFDNDKDIDLYLANSYATFDQPNILYDNQGNGTFIAIAQGGGAAGTSVGPVWLDFETGSKLATSDFDNDGFLDIFVSSNVARSPRKTYLGTPSQLLSNQGNSNNWLLIDLEGVQSNRDGIGAQVRVTSGGTIQLREQNGGTHNFAQNDTRLHFGLGSDNLVNQVEITWPSGVTQLLNNVAVNQVLTITEPFANTIIGNSNNNLLQGGAAADQIEGLAGNDTLNGFGGRDNLLGGEGTDSLLGSEGADSLAGGDGNDIIKGGEDNDFILGDGDNDSLEGNDGDDTIAGNLGSDRIFGGAGYDLLSGNEGADTINGNNEADLIYGDEGNDVLNGDDGDDTLQGGDDNDELFGSLGKDSLEGNDGNDTLNGDNGNDTVDGGNGADLVRGQKGDDLVIGGNGNDTLKAGEGADSLFGGNDNDFIEGEGGFDELYGEAGDDTLRGGNGDDTIFGGAGSDRVLETGNLNFTVTDTQVIGRGTDTFSEVELVEISTGGGQNNIDASAVTQLPVKLNGAGGRDTLQGGAGDDELLGGADIDTLTGNAGSDRFVYLGLNHRNDVISDFEAGVDKIVVSAAAFGSGLTAGILDPSQFVLGNVPGDADDRFLFNTNNNRLLFDADGTGSGNAIVVATLSNSNVISNQDIEVIG